MKTKAMLVLASVTIVMALASNAGAITSSAGEIYAISPDSASGGIGAQHFFDGDPNDYWVDLVVDLGAAKPVGQVRIDRWEPNTPQNEKMRDCEVYIGDESDPGFDPCDLADYVTQIGSGSMDNDNAELDFNITVTPSIVRYLHLRSRSHWMVATDPCSSSRIINKDIDVAPFPEGGVACSAGTLHGIAPDRASGGIGSQYYFDGDPNDFWVDMVLDLGSTELVGSILIERWAPATAQNEKLRECYVYAGAESDPDFHPFSLASYDTQIGHGDMGGDNASIDFDFGLTLGDRRYLYLRCRSHWMAAQDPQWSHRIINQDIDVGGWAADIMVNAGGLNAINGDGVSGGPTTQYMWDHSHDFWFEAILDLDPSTGGQKLVDTMTFTRWGSTTNENMREAFIYAADEDDPCFYPPDSSLYVTEIGHGLMYNDNTGGPMFIDLTNTTARYLYIKAQSHWMAGSTANYRILNKSVDITEGAPEFSDCNDVRDKGKVLTGDLNSDCYVDIGDLLVIVGPWLDCTLPTDPDCTVVRKRPTYAIAKDPCVVVDGLLDDWDDAEWIALSDVYYGEPIDIGNQVDDAKFALKWDDGTDKVYAAVVVEDTDHIYESAPTNWDSSDRIEVYAQGDPNGGLDYGAGGSVKFDIAQQYAVGFEGLIQGDSWAVFGDGTFIPGALDPGDAEFEHSVRTSGTTITYEVGAKMFIFYGGYWTGIDSEVRQLQAGYDVGFDIIADTRHGAGFGMRSENMFTQKYRDAGQFQLYELVDGELPPLTNCGDWGFLTADMDMNCEVNLGDVLELSKDWLKCNDPLYVDGGPCVANW